jgi:hypothetical protein
MRNQLKIVYSALTIVAMLGLTSTVQGVPSFARQTGLDCNSCHAAAGYPTLNSFGAAFKAAGYTQGNDDDMIGDGEALSIPKSLNASMVYKVRTPLDVKKGKSTMHLQNPDEIALLIGGRAGKNIGWLTELGGTGIDAASFKLVFAPELGPVRLGIVPWFSDLTPGYAFETMSTGAVRNIRAVENRKMSSAMNSVNYGAVDDYGTNGMNAGIGLYVWHPIGFVAFTPFWDRDIADGPDMLKDKMGYYARAAVTPTLGALELGAGVQYYGGAYKAVDGDTGVSSTKKLGLIGVDAQAMMNVGIPLAAFVTFATDIANKATSLNVLVDAAIIPDVLMVDLGTRIDLSSKAKDSKTGAMLAGKLHINRNTKLEVDVAYTFASGDLQVLPLIFGAF